MGEDQSTLSSDRYASAGPGNLIGEDPDQWPADRGARHYSLRSAAPDLARAKILQRQVSQLTCPQAARTRGGHTDGSATNHALAFSLDHTTVPAHGLIGLPPPSIQRWKLPARNSPDIEGKVAGAGWDGRTSQLSGRSRSACSRGKSANKPKIPSSNQRMARGSGLGI